MSRVTLQVVIVVPSSVDGKDVAAFVRYAIRGMPGCMDPDHWVQRMKVSSVTAGTTSFAVSEADLYGEP